MFTWWRRWRKTVKRQKKSRRLDRRPERYSWDAVTDEYERLLDTVIAMAGPGSLPRELLDDVSERGTPQPATAPPPSAA